MMSNVFGLALLAGLLLLAPLASAQSRDYAETVQGVRFMMKSIPGGAFLMGCGIEDEPCAEEEWADQKTGRRQRLVMIKSFYLAETETTWALYQQCIDGGSCPSNDAYGGDNGWGKDSRPVIEVSWQDVTEHFLPWLNRETGKTYRLPTEAEWEYAARAGTKSRFSWGPEIDCTKARYGYMSESCESPASTTPVKSFPPNNFGLYDMHGNVWEMVQDCWKPGGSPSTTSISALKGACKESVLRGGSWLNEPRFLRSAARFHHDRTFRESGDGFRVAHSKD